jgi:hypothetical protein
MHPEPVINSTRISRFVRLPGQSLFTLPRRVALRAKTGPGDAEPEGFGDS